MFTIFSELPSELRLKIWQQACSPRIITLTYNSKTSTFTSPTPHPTLLSVSHESRHEALRIYTLSFGTSSSPPKTYFNPLLDTIYLPRHQEMGYDETLRDFRQLVHDPSNLLDQLSNIAIDHVNVDVKRPWESYNKTVFLRSFPHLDQIALILDSDGKDAGDLIMDLDTSPSSPLPSPSAPSCSLTPEVKKKSSQGRLVFEAPRIDPEHLLKIWYYFRQSFMIEERLLEDICRDSSGREYVAFELPTLRILAKSYYGEDVGSGEGIGRQVSSGRGAGVEKKHLQAALDIMRL